MRQVVGEYRFFIFHRYVFNKTLLKFLFFYCFPQTDILYYTNYNFMISRLLSCFINRIREDLMSLETIHRRFYGVVLFRTDLFVSRSTRM